MKVALIFDHFGPYHLARARAAAEIMEVTCIELHAKSRSYGWEAGKSVANVELVSLQETDLRGVAERRWLEPHLARSLREAKPDAVAINASSLAPRQRSTLSGVKAIVIGSRTTTVIVSSVLAP